MDLRQRRRAIAAAKFTPEEDAVGGLLAAVSSEPFGSRTLKLWNFIFANGD